MNTSGRADSLEVMETSPLVHFWHSGEIDMPAEALIAWARAQRLLPLIGWRAEREGWALPATLQEMVRTARYRQAARQTLAARQLRSLAALVHENDLAVGVVKGPVVAEAYPSSDLRPYRDLDLLVPTSDVSELVSLLKSEGYMFLMDGGRRWHLPPLEPPEAGFELEIHMALARDRQGKSLFTWETWQDCMQPWERFPALQRPAEVEHWLYLVHHLAVHHHFEMGVLSLMDLHYLAQDWSGAMWRRLVDLADQLNMRRDVGLCLYLANWWCGDERFEEPAALFPTPPQGVFRDSQNLILGAIRAAGPKIERDVEGNSFWAWMRHMRVVLFGEFDTRAGMDGSDRLRFQRQRLLYLFQHYGPWASKQQNREQKDNEAHRIQRDLMGWLRGAD